MEQVKFARLRYYGGVTNYLEVLGSERRSFQVAIDLSRARQASDLEAAARTGPVHSGGDSS